MSLRFWIERAAVNTKTAAEKTLKEEAARLVNRYAQGEDVWGELKALAERVTCCQCHECTQAQWRMWTECVETRKAMQRVC
jgi:hypothetical protein